MGKVYIPISSVLVTNLLRLLAFLQQFNYNFFNDLSTCRRNATRSSRES